MYNSIEYVSGLVDLTKRNIDFNIERYTTVLKDYYKKTDDEILDFVDKEKDLLEYKLFYLNRKLRFYRWLQENIGFREMSVAELKEETRRLEKVYESEVE